MDDFNRLKAAIIFDGMAPEQAALQYLKTEGANFKGAQVLASTPQTTTIELESRGEFEKTEDLTVEIRDLTHGINLLKNGEINGFAYGSMIYGRWSAGYRVRRWQQDTICLKIVDRLGRECSGIYIPIDGDMSPIYCQHERYCRPLPEHLRDKIASNLKESGRFIAI